MLRGLKTTREFINTIPFPVYTKGNYTVVPHLQAAELIEYALLRNNFEIDREELMIAKNGQVCSGSIVLKNLDDYESECVVSFINSYDKSIAFRVWASIRMKESGNLFVLSRSNFGGIYKRVHKGTANEDISEAITTTIAVLEKDFENLLEQKAKLKNIILDSDDVMILLGDMFFNEELLNVEQFSYVKQELKNPTYSYNANNCSAFHYYMLCCLAFQNRNSIINKFWDNHVKLHEYFMKKYNILVSGDQLVFDYAESD